VAQCSGAHRGNWYFLVCLVVVTTTTTMTITCCYIPACCCHLSLVRRFVLFVLRTSHFSKQVVWWCGWMLVSIRYCSKLDDVESHYNKLLCRLLLLLWGPGITLIKGIARIQPHILARWFTRLHACTTRKSRFPDWQMKWVAAANISLCLSCSIIYRMRCCCFWVKQKEIKKLFLYLWCA
jgi:hypothetical protein